MTPDEPKSEPVDRTKMRAFEWLLHEPAIKADQRVLEGVAWMVAGFQQALDDARWQANRRFEVEQERDAAHEKIASMREALQELVSAVTAIYPPYEAGREAQEAHVTRQVRAIAAASEVLALKC